MPIAKRARSRAAVALLILAGVVGAAILVRAVATPVRASDSNALWHIVHDLCVADMKVRHAPAPCLAVDLTRGYAVLKDIRGQTQVLVIPTRRVSGIESPALLEPGSENYFEDAWEARRFVEMRARRALPREDVGLAINSLYGRSQNQLHIHVDCVGARARLALAANEARIGNRWAAIPGDPLGWHYHVRRLMGADLGTNDPVKLMAQGDPKARDDMSLETLVVIGAVFADGAPGFFLLSDRASVFNKAAGEELLDHDCAVLAGQAPGRAAS
jgi:CDP-diacylglycerol pyrophosphatase